jgi:CheY-like chemotaxis protein
MQKLPSRSTILVVEDQDIILEFLELLLIDLGYDFLAATNGKVALERIQTTPPDLVISDFSMPGLNGWQLVQAIRALPAGHHLPIILMSAGRAFPFTPADLDERTAFIAKPFAIADMQTLIEHLLGNSGV